MPGVFDVVDALFPSADCTAPATAPPGNPTAFSALTSVSGEFLDKYQYPPAAATPMPRKTVAILDDFCSEVVEEAYRRDACSYQAA